VNEKMDCTKNRYPQVSEREVINDSENPAISLYGKRFYKDQTPVEYLAEFFLVFVSPKGRSAEDGRSFSFMIDTGSRMYWPGAGVALKLFAFFPTSKLETRHQVHQQAYMAALRDMKSRINGSDEDQEETVRLLQSLFSGFVGVARNRTWVTHSFLPASPALLSREVDWLHSKAMKDQSVRSWGDAVPYFATDKHNFLARGGELLFLQLAHLFSQKDRPEIDSLKVKSGYSHLNLVCLDKLREDVESGITNILSEAAGPITELARFVENSLENFEIHEHGKPASLGWVPAASMTEALLFAVELKNICNSSLGPLEKIDLLQLLCCMQVLRSHCFQASRIAGDDLQMDWFVGGYAWIAASPTASPTSATRKLAESSLAHTNGLLFRALRIVGGEYGDGGKKYAAADKHGFQIFKKIAKEIGLVIPKTGKNPRFVLTPTLLRFLVAAVLAPGERVRLTEFYRRVFAHYGIALGTQQLVSALNIYDTEAQSQDYSIAANTEWIEEALQQGGFLVELSDAVSIVYNPGNSE